MQLSGFDLNLLVILDALLQTRSVKQAAARVALSPSATSHALSRLRDLFDDPLLLRAGRSLVLSARAEALRPVVREALAAIDGVFLEGRPVEPATLKRRFVVSTTDYAELVLLQEVGAALAGSAPGVDLYCRRAHGLLVDELRTGDADLAVGVYRHDLAPDLARRPLFDERFVCVLRQGHPALDDGGLDLDRYCALDHVLVSPSGDGRGIVDRLLETEGRQRRVARTVEGFLAAPHMVAGTDYVVTLASRIAHRYAAFLDLVIAEPPLPLPKFTISLLWHQRHERDEAHRWLREQLVDVASRL